MRPDFSAPLGTGRSCLQAAVSSLEACLVFQDAWVQACSDVSLVCRLCASLVYRSRRNIVAQQPFVSPSCEGEMWAGESL